MRVLLLLALVASLLAPDAWCRSTSRIRCTGCKRDPQGRISRSSKAKREFQRRNPCPSTGKRSGRCPGYDVDHRLPLYKGGSDTPSNMQWLSKGQHKAKHRKR